MKANNAADPGKKSESTRIHFASFPKNRHCDIVNRQFPRPVKYFSHFFCVLLRTPARSCATCSRRPNVFKKRCYVAPGRRPSNEKGTSVNANNAADLGNMNNKTQLNMAASAGAFPASDRLPAAADFSQSLAPWRLCVKSNLCKARQIFLPTFFTRLRLFVPVRACTRPSLSPSRLMT